jgi:hypothetical protein
LIRYLAVTQFQDNHARKAFICYDEPRHKATFDLTIRHDKSYNVLSNMPAKTRYLKNPINFALFQFNNNSLSQVNQLELLQFLKQHQLCLLIYWHL